MTHEQSQNSVFLSLTLSDVSYKFAHFTQCYSKLLCNQGKQHKSHKKYSIQSLINRSIETWKLESTPLKLTPNCVSLIGIAKAILMIRMKTC